MARYYEENALIEFVKQYTPTINGETTMKCVERAIREAPTADVVPKSEVEKIFEEIDGITDLFAKGLIGEFEMYDKLAELKKKCTESEGKG